MKTLTGIIHGNVIELKEDPGLAEGEQVEISLRVISNKISPGDGLRRSAGALAAGADAVEDDRILEELDRQRHAAAFRPLFEGSHHNKQKFILH